MYYLDMHGAAWGTRDRDKHMYAVDHDAIYFAREHGLGEYGCDSLMIYPDRRRAIRTTDGKPLLTRCKYLDTVLKAKEKKKAKRKSRTEKRSMYRRQLRLIKQHHPDLLKTAGYLTPGEVFDKICVIDSALASAKDRADNLQEHNDRLLAVCIRQGAENADLTTKLQEYQTRLACTNNLIYVPESEERDRVILVEEDNHVRESIRRDIPLCDAK
jgi:hypothetical protein